jgi:hypothetical protein
MTLTRRGQPQHGTAEAVVLGKIAINRNAVNLVVADDRLNELITAIRRVPETIRQLCYPTTLLSRTPLTRQSSYYSRRNRRGMNADFFKN